jgi:tetraacyldisaccharide 4'-kinase
VSSALERIWYGDDAAARLARVLLGPGSWLYAGAVRTRNALFDHGALATHQAGVPVLSVGNLSVGGTGKTPIAAWAARRLLDAGAHPAIVLRGYGGDEPLVHGRLNPALHVIAHADRVAAAREAQSRGADCIVLDDGFQHRRLARAIDWVLVAAEHADSARLLPSGPLREPPAELRRASVVIVTRKSASAEQAAVVADRLGPITVTREAAVCHLDPHDLVDAIDGTLRPVEALAGMRVVAVAAVGNPAAFVAQLQRLGASIAAPPRAYRDHHEFDDADVREIVHAARGCDGVVCTLKDAVKLAPRWPRAAPTLWYVSQRVVVERGASALDASIASILAARADLSSTAGLAG